MNKLLLSVILISLLAIFAFSGVVSAVENIGTYTVGQSVSYSTSAFVIDSIRTGDWEIYSCNNEDYGTWIYLKTPTQVPSSWIGASYVPLGFQYSFDKPGSYWCALGVDGNKGSGPGQASDFRVGVYLEFTINSISNGASCSSNSECSSGNCVGGYCCSLSSCNAYCSGNVRYYSGSCSSGSCSYSTENCDNKDGCSGSTYYDYYCSGGQCAYTTYPNDARCGSCSETDMSCGTYPNCVNCNNYDTYSGSKFCSGSNVYQTYRNYYCSSGSCTYSDSDQLQQSCTHYCSNGACTGECVPDSITSSGCSSGATKTCTSSYTWGSCTGGSVCTADETECYGNYIKKCESGGTWNNYYQYCSGGCKNGQCITIPTGFIKSISTCADWKKKGIDLSGGTYVCYNTNSWYCGSDGIMYYQNCDWGDCNSDTGKCRYSPGTSSMPSGYIKSNSTESCSGAGWSKGGIGCFQGNSWICGYDNRWYSKSCESGCNSSTGKCIITSKTCPTCSSPTSWSSCVNNQQTRTNYNCGSSTNYQCQSYTETQSCSEIVAFTVKFLDIQNEQINSIDKTDLPLYAQKIIGSYFRSGESVYILLPTSELTVDGTSYGFIDFGKSGEATTLFFDSAGNIVSDQNLLVKLFVAQINSNKIANLLSKYSLKYSYEISTLDYPTILQISGTYVLIPDDNYLKNTVIPYQSGFTQDLQSGLQEVKNVGTVTSIIGSVIGLATTYYSAQVSPLTALDTISLYLDEAAYLKNLAYFLNKPSTLPYDENFANIVYVLDTLKSTIDSAKSLREINNNMRLYHLYGDIKYKEAAQSIAKTSFVESSSTINYYIAGNTIKSTSDFCINFVDGYSRSIYDRAILMEILQKKLDAGKISHSDFNKYLFLDFDSDLALYRTFVETKDSYRNVLGSSITSITMGKLLSSESVYKDINSTISVLEKVLEQGLENKENMIEFLNERTEKSLERQGKSHTPLTFNKVDMTNTIKSIETSTSYVISQSEKKEGQSPIQGIGDAIWNTIGGFFKFFKI